MKTIKTLYILLIFVCCSVVAMGGSISPKQNERPFVLILDPGHGGKDYGAVGKITNEKTINLDVSRLIGQKLEKAFKDNLKIIYTRSNDKYLSLKERSTVANKNHGNLFVSIHVNSVDKNNRNRSSVKGASVYTLGLHKSSDNLNVARRENAVMTLDDNFEEIYEGFDPQSTESYIIFELSQNLHMAQSVRLADDIQHRLVTEAGRADRGVRQDGFWVLWATGMPAVLVELDFICNPEQEKFMASTAGKEKMANAVASALSRYIATVLGSAVPKIEHTEIVEDVAEVETISQHESKTDTTLTAQPQKIFKIQFLTSSKKLKETSPELKGLENVDYYIDRGIYKYTTGAYSTKADAQTALRAVRKKFGSAFVVSFFDGKRVE